MILLGHDRVLAALEQPQNVMLFLGPRGVGKRTAAHFLLDEWNIPEDSRYEFLSLDMAGARALAEVARFGVADSPVAVIRLNHTTAEVQNVLLKALEESTTMRFILLAEQDPEVTISSRAHLSMFRPLSTEQVFTLLLRLGYAPKKAQSLATLSEGTVRSARAAESLLDAKPNALAAVKAIAEQDPVALDKLATKWTDHDTAMLRRWVHEVLSQNFSIFSEEDALLPRPTALKILIALSSDVRPKLQVRAGLMGLVVAA